MGKIEKDVINHAKMITKLVRGEVAAEISSGEEKNHVENEENNSRATDLSPKHANSTSNIARNLQLIAPTKQTFCSSRGKILVQHNKFALFSRLCARK